MIIRPLQEHDDRSQFSSRDLEYDRFLRRYAGQNQFRHRIGTTMVAVEDEVVIGYATFTVGEIDADESTDAARRRLPRYPLPALRLARLAVDERYQGAGIGTELVAQVLLVALRLRADIGCAAVTVDAVAELRDFYSRLGFEEAGLVAGKHRVPGTVPMVLPLEDLEAAARQEK